MKLPYSILGTALFSLGACAPEEPVCNQYNETTITLNQQVNMGY